MGKIKNMQISQQEEEEMLLEEARQHRIEMQELMDRDKEDCPYSSTNEQFEAECGARP